MTDLDDVAALRAADPGGMLDAVMQLPRHCREAYELGRMTPGPPGAEQAASIAFCGMGGSAIAGDVVRALFARALWVPMTVVRSSELPAHCGPATLVLASSYSGGTAETLALFEEAVRRGCLVGAITSGGELGSRADELGIPCLRVPQGFTMPRVALAYLALGTIGMLVGPGLMAPIDTELEDAVRALERVLEECGPDVPSSANPAKALALAIGERVPVVWGAEGVGAVAAARWKAQLNENAKVPAFWSELPELDHNEVVGWSPGRGREFFVVALRHDGELPDVAARFPPSIDIAASAGAGVAEVWARGGSDLSRLFGLVLRGDLVSTYLAISRGVDPTPIEAIEQLKRVLAESSAQRSTGEPSGALPAGWV